MRPDEKFEILEISRSGEPTAPIRTKNAFVNQSDKPILFEVFTKEDDEVLAMNEFIAANHIETAQNRVNKALKSRKEDEPTKIDIFPILASFKFSPN